METKINFEYSFAVPHRICICLPEASKKTLLDATNDEIIMSWTDRDTRSNPLGAYKSLVADWKVKFTAEANNKKLMGNKWHRVEQWIPAFYYEWCDNDIKIEVRIVATEYGDSIHIKMVNSSDKEVVAGIYAYVEANVVNLKWVDFNYNYSICTPIWGDRGDRMVLLNVEELTTIPRSREHVDFEYTLAPKEEKETYFIRPYKSYVEDLEMLLALDWKAETEKGLNVWREKLSYTPRIDIPDYMVLNAFKAGVADMFVMREEQADGSISGLAGTDMYRAANTAEPCIQAMALARLGYYKEALDNILFVNQFQEADGNWEDEKQWGRFMWSASGRKSLAIKEYYLQTGDLEFLKSQFDRMLASSRWSQKQREKTKIINSPDSPEWGLMPRGMGDCGLMNDNDLFGVFYPHNFYHCMGLEIAAWTAKEIGCFDVYDELYNNYIDMYNCLHKSLEKGCIHEEDGSVWIPGAPNKITGSRWGVADAIYPTAIIDKDSELAKGTMQKLQGQLSEGGLPINLGWIKDGIWVAIALDSIAYVNILNGNSEISANYLYAAINHGTPLFTWCEERTGEKNTQVKTGDLQHAWTPICISMFVRDMLVMEDFDRDTIYLTRAVPSEWYGEGNYISVSLIPTYYGKVSYLIKRHKNNITFSINLKDFDYTKKIVLQITKELNLKDVSIKGGKAYIEKNSVVIYAENDEISGNIYFSNKKFI